MIINNGDNPGISGSQLNRAGNSALDKNRRSGASSSPTGSSDQVSLSGDQASLSKLLSAVSDTGQSSEVQELQRLYSSGQYTVDSAEVSKSLVQAALIGE